MSCRLTPHELLSTGFPASLEKSWPRVQPQVRQQNWRAQSTARVWLVRKKKNCARQWRLWPPLLNPFLVEVILKPTRNICLHMHTCTPALSALALPVMYVRADKTAAQGNSNNNTCHSPSETNIITHRSRRAHQRANIKICSAAAAVPPQLNPFKLESSSSPDITTDSLQLPVV